MNFIVYDHLLNGCFYGGKIYLKSKKNEMKKLDEQKYERIIPSFFF